MIRASANDDLVQEMVNVKFLRLHGKCLTLPCLRGEWLQCLLFFWAAGGSQVLESCK